MGSESTTIGLPVARGIIMFGRGLSLTLADFSRVLKQPKAATSFEIGIHNATLAIVIAQSVLGSVEPAAGNGS